MEKAFDTVWHRGLLFKLYHITDHCLDLTAIVYHFLKMRRIVPRFQGLEGGTILPEAGVPQGSSLGPILFNIFVNDHPQPIHKDSVIAQFADDMVHVVCSSGKGINKVKQAKIYMESELTQTQEWESMWKIKSNIGKSSISCMGTSEDKLLSLGGVCVQDKDLPIQSYSKILGAKFSRKTGANGHVRGSINMASGSLQRLRRFTSAPQRVKKTLYKMLTRPVMEYPPVFCRKTSSTVKTKMQKLQNRALRFIKGVKLSDRVNMENLHKELNIDPMNVRLDRLTNKSLNKMKEMYYLPKNQQREVMYKYSDYALTEPPIRLRRKSLAERIDKHILKPRYHRNFIKDEPICTDWQPPEPIYTGNRS